jgi:hypothetical protein
MDQKEKDRKLFQKDCKQEMSHKGVLKRHFNGLVTFIEIFFYKKNPMHFNGYIYILT